MNPVPPRGQRECCAVTFTGISRSAAFSSVSSGSLFRIRRWFRCPPRRARMKREPGASVHASLRPGGGVGRKFRGCTRNCQRRVLRHTATGASALGRRRKGADPRARRPAVSRIAGSGKTPGAARGLFRVKRHESVGAAGGATRHAGWRVLSFIASRVLPFGARGDDPC